MTPSYKRRQAALAQWNHQFNDAAVKLSPAHAGRINWLVVAYYRDTLALSPADAAARYTEHEEPIEPIFGKPV